MKKLNISNYITTQDLRIKKLWMAQVKKYFTTIFDKLFLWHWTIGFSHVKIEDIIRLKLFDPEIQWVSIDPFCRFIADPFYLRKSNSSFSILVEELNFKEDYGKIVQLTFDEAFQKIKRKVILDLQSHLSYPFIYSENNKTYIFPEASESGGLQCYEYDNVSEELIFLRTVIDHPIIDPTLVKYNNTYWIFGTLPLKNPSGNLVIFYSKSLLGPYKPHPNNPVKNSLNGSRPAGSFINVDGVLYRPSQNCLNRYGESITVNRILVLNETDYLEEPYMQIEINKKKAFNKGIHTIHTINAYENIIVVDGAKRLFAPIFKTRQWFQRRFKKKN